jgi:outer membrane protein TolC
VRIADRSAWLAALALVVATVPASAQEARVVTLAEALQRAEAVTPAIIQARGALRSAELQTRTNIMRYIPQLSFPLRADYNVSTGQQRLDPVTGLLIGGAVTNPSYSVGAQASLTLFDGFNRERTLSASRSREDAADASLRSSLFQSRLSVTNAFFDVLANQQLLRVNEAAVARARQQLAVATARFQSGAGQRGDSLTAVVQFGQARQQLLTAQANLATAEAALGRLIGETGRVSAAEDSAFYQAVAIPDTASLRLEAISASPAVRSAEATLEANKMALRASRSGYWPTITASASSDWTANKFNDYTLEPRRNLLFSMNFQPWSNLQRETQIENAAITVDNSVAQLEDQKRLVASQVTQQFAALANARESIEVSQLSVQASDENLRVVEQRYRLGVGTIFELLQAQEQLTQAQVTEIQARFSYLRAKAQIEALLGRTI